MVEAAHPLRAETEGSDKSAEGPKRALPLQGAPLRGIESGRRGRCRDAWELPRISLVDVTLV